MSTTEEQLPLLFTALYQIRVLNYVTLSSAAFLVYDVLINLDKEVHFIWRYYHDTDETPISWPYRLRRILVQALLYLVAIMDFCTSLCTSLFTITMAYPYLCQGFYYYYIL
ncbi:hypothetical protein EDC04DRAFT_641975 [Pisolithus marmoratus]|nr:hypothetical protein EDC04DRAFT_641975 [Pisolithus marmoratus]